MVDSAGDPVTQVWQEKLDFLRREEAIASDSAQRFQLAQLIREAEAKLAALRTERGQAPAAAWRAGGPDVLVLAANPSDESRLALEAEVQLIRARLHEGTLGRTMAVEVELALRVEDFSRQLLAHRPRLVHFSGHGRRDGTIVSLGRDGQSHLVSASSLAGLFAVAGKPVECVVLNACFSAERAELLATHVDFVIGMGDEITDEAALSFSAGFYRALAFDLDYARAFQLARNEIELMGLPEGATPRLVARSRATTAQPQL